MNLEGEHHANSRLSRYLFEYLNKDYIDVDISASQLTCRSIEGFDVGCKEGICVGSMLGAVRGCSVGCLIGCTEGTPEGSSHGCFVGE